MQNTSISGRLIVYSQPEVNQPETLLLCPDENAFTAPLHCWYANYFMGSKTNSGWHFHHSYLIVFYFPGNADMAKASMVVERWGRRITPACSVLGLNKAMEFWIKLLLSLKLFHINCEGQKRKKKKNTDAIITSSRFICGHRYLGKSQHLRLIWKVNIYTL